MDRLRVSANGEAVLSMSLSGDGSKLAFGGVDGVLRVVDVRSGREISQSRPAGDPEDHIIRAVEFVPNGQEVAFSGDDRVVRLVNAGTGNTVIDLPGHDGVVRVMRRFKDGSKLVSAGEDGTALIWNVGRGASR
jgi:WD40 repeat protein